MLLISKDNPPHTYSRFIIDCLHWLQTPTRLLTTEFKLYKSLICASPLSHSFTHQYWDYWNTRLGLVQELHVGTTLILKVHRSQCFISKKSLYIHFSVVVFLSQILMLVTKRKVCSGHSKEKYILFTEFHNFCFTLQEHLLIKKNPVWNESINTLKSNSLSFSPGCKKA